MTTGRYRGGPGASHIGKKVFGGNKELGYFRKRASAFIFLIEKTKDASTIKTHWKFNNGKETKCVVSSSDHMVNAVL